jgi:hypothetical protein
MIIHARKDPEKGSQMIQGYQWTISTFFSTIGAILTAYFLESGHVEIVLMIFSGCGLVILATLLLTDDSFEQDNKSQEISWEKTKENLNTCYVAA